MKSDNGCSHQRGRHEGWRVLGGPRGWIQATGERDSNRRRCSAVAARRGAPATLILSLRVFVFVYLDETVFVCQNTIVFVFLEEPASLISITSVFVFPVFLTDTYLCLFILSLFLYFYVFSVLSTKQKIYFICFAVFHFRRDDLHS